MTISNPIESEKLLLRPIDGSDRQAYFELIQSSDILIMVLKAGETFSEEWFDKHFQKILDSSNNQRHRWAVISKANKNFIGLVSLIVEKDDYHAEIGYWIGQEYRGAGLATDACKLLMRVSFEQPGFHRIFAFTYPYNRPSIRVLEKLAMQKEGVMREHVYLDGRFHDMILYGILRSEFLKSHP